MTDTACTFERRGEFLVAYLYDDLPPDERQSFTAHLSRCRVCRAELDDLRDVRSDLVHWAPPSPARVLTFSQVPAHRSRVWSALAEIPAWTQVAAALLVLGVAAGIANLQVRVDDNGFTVRTGWAAPDRLADAASPQPAAAAPPEQADAPWRADLAALETAMRAERQTPGPAAPADNTAVLRQVRTLIAASESSQRRELALRVAELSRDFQVQRTADLQRIQRTFTVLENTTTGEMVKQRVMMNNLANLASQRQ
jgi:putative zinc finger protein